MENEHEAVRADYAKWFDAHPAAWARQEAPPLDFQDHLENLIEEVEDLMLSRHAKYGAGNISEHGMTGIVVRLSDKHARLRMGLENHNDETLEDTLLDVVGYGLIGLLWHRGLWPGSESDG